MLKRGRWFDAATATRAVASLVGLLVWPLLALRTNRPPVRRSTATIGNGVILDRLKELETLTLYSNHISDLGVKHLTSLTRLQSLTLNNSQITDAGLPHLQQLMRLRFVSLDNTKITDRGMVSLKVLTSLQSISVKNTGVTYVGVDSLQVALPACKISY